MNCFLVDMSVKVHYRWQQTQSTEWRANNSSTCLYFYWEWWRTYGCPFCLPSRITLVNGTPTYMLTFRPFIRENGQVPGPNLIVWKNQTIITVSSQLQIQTVSIHWHAAVQYALYGWNPPCSQASHHQGLYFTKPVSQHKQMHLLMFLCHEVVHKHITRNNLDELGLPKRLVELYVSENPLIDKQLFPLYEWKIWSLIGLVKELDQAISQHSIAKRKTAHHLAVGESVSLDGNPNRLWHICFLEL